MSDKSASGNPPEPQGTADPGAPGACAESADQSEPQASACATRPPASRLGAPGATGGLPASVRAASAKRAVEKSKRKAWYKRGTGLVAWMIYAAVRSAFAIMQVFPVEWNLRTARLCARIWKRLLPRHYTRAVEHIRLAFGSSLSNDQVDKLADQCLDSVTMFAVEAVCLPRVVDQFTFTRYIDLVNFDEVLKLLVSGRGFILVTGHYGSFELPGHLLAALGFDVHAVMRPLDNDYLNRFIVRSRATQGMKLIDKKGATATAEAIIRDGGLLAFIGDQDAGRKGIFVDFFGQPASTYKSIGLLAMTTQCPIVVGYARRQGARTRYEIGVERIIRPEEWAGANDPLRWITQTYTTSIETIVRNDPSQYLWIHRRWKSKPKERATRELTHTV